MKKFIRRLICMLCAAALAMSMPALAAEKYTYI